MLLLTVVGGVKLIKINFIPVIHDPTTNNCGPGYSDGKFQKSVGIFETTPIDYVDFTCQEHDRDTYNCNDNPFCLDTADNDFLYRNYSNPSVKGILYSSAAKLVNKSTRLLTSAYSKKNLRMSEGTEYDPYHGYDGPLNAHPVEKQNLRGVYDPGNETNNDKQIGTFSKSHDFCDTYQDPDVQEAGYGSLSRPKPPGPFETGYNSQDYNTWEREDTDNWVRRKPQNLKPYSMSELLGILKKKKRRKRNKVYCK